MDTWTKEAVEKIAAMLRMSLAEDGLLEKKTTPRRAKSKTAGGPTKSKSFKCCMGMLVKSNFNYIPNVRQGLIPSWGIEHLHFISRCTRKCIYLSS